ncbi:MAG: type II toxin-antitoxin system RatA family toxin [Alphaproteobacteria bacterium]|nr:type II toxin-antitoxin system RatA family toxin [Alphaproteobacteria bacterium]MDE2492796.1 type II toxin-antitoxin system RatA family toxin [Alphaproteobacteria bacterium]
MTAHAESRNVPYAADLMYAVVAEVEKYPEFLPWCAGLRVLSREQVKAHDVLLAEMLVGFGNFRERYTSRVILDPANRAVDVTHMEGPFRQLDTHWRFIPEGDGCKVDFSITFEFKNRLLGAVAGNAFEHVLLKMTDAFEARAKSLSEKPA